VLQLNSGSVRRRYLGISPKRAAVIGVGLAPLFLLTCASGLTFERQRLFLSLADVSGGPAPVICSVQFFDRGLVQYGCGEDILVAQLAAGELVALEDRVRSPNWRESVRSFAARECPSCSDYAELHVYYRIGQEEFSTHAPTENVPDEMLPFLREADALLKQHFGDEIRNQFEPSSNAA